MYGYIIPFTLTNASAVFQRVMDSLFKEEKMQIPQSLLEHYEIKI